MVTISTQSPLAHPSSHLSKLLQLSPSTTLKAMSSTQLNLGAPSYLHQIFLQKIATQAVPTTTNSTFTTEITLLNSLLAKAPDDPLLKKTVSFCHFLIQRAQQVRTSLPEIAIDQVRAQIGQIVFLTEQNPSLIARQLSSINSKAVDNSLKQVDATFRQQISLQLQQIEARATLHAKVPLQDFSMTSRIRTPLIIANALINSSGVLNLNIIDALKTIFCDIKHRQLLQWEKELLYTLDCLKQSKTLQEQLLAIEKPSSHFSSSNALIRTSLGLPLNQTVTDRDAKVVALAALLSDMRQGPVGSCFATSISIMMMGAAKERVLSDFAAILKEGKLSRPSLKETDQTDFVPVLDIGDNDIQASIPIDGTGYVQGAKGYLWEAPGIQSACTQIGIASEDIPTLVKAGIQQLYEEQLLSPTKKTLVTPEDVLNATIAVFTKEKNLTADEISDLQNAAYFAFSSETNTPLLRGWETCLAAMAEATNGGLVRQRMLSCVSTALFDRIQSCFSGLSDTAKKAQEVFIKVLDLAVQERYDPNVSFQTSELTGDGHSTREGAFVAYALTQSINGIIAREAANPEKFGQLIVRSLSTTHTILGNAFPHDLRMQQTIEKIQKIITSSNTAFNDLLEDVMKKYTYENAYISDLLERWEQIKHLPFRDATGNDNVAVYIKATGINPGQPNIVRPRNAQQLLISFIEFGRKRAHIDQFLTDDDPYQLYMAGTPQHAFSLTPEDESIVEAMKSRLPPKEWINTNITQPGKAIANTNISATQIEQLIASITQQMVPPEYQMQFYKKTARLNTQNLTIAQCCSHILQILLELFNSNSEAVRSALSSNISTILLNKILPSSALNIISSSAAKIADTNWESSGGKHISFVCFFDPASNQIQLGTMNEDDSELSTVDQSEWVTYIPWEMYGVKLTPTLAERKIEQLHI